MVLKCKSKKDLAGNGFDPLRHEGTTITQGTDRTTVQLTFSDEHRFFDSISPEELGPRLLYHLRYWRDSRDTINHPEEVEEMLNEYKKRM